MSRIRGIEVKVQKEVLQTRKYGLNEILKKKNEDVSSGSKDDVEKNQIGELLQKLPKLDKVFEVHRKIGEGTFSSVYLGSLRQHAALPAAERRWFAIKHLVPTAHPARVEHELRCLRDMGGKHHVIGVDLCLRHLDTIVFIMPYIPHRKFSEYVHAMDAAEVRRYMRALLTALRHVHSFGVIHRDVKPSNFLYDRENRRYMLVDFGLAQRLCPAPASAPATPGPPEPPPAHSTHLRKRPREEQDEAAPDSKRAALDLSAGSRTRVRDQPAPAPAPSPRDPAPAAPAPRSLPRAHTVAQKGGAGACACAGVGGVCAACGTRAGARAPRAGTQGYRPPEVLLKVAAQTTAVDTWAAGVVLASALTARYVLASVRHAACGTRAGARAPRAGTQGYRPPEVLLKVAAQTTAVDTWAAGVVLASALTARYVLASVRHAACGTRAGARAPRAGTQGYRPPEVLLKVAAQTTAVDTWAAGVVLASALTARYVLASVRHAACGTRAGARAPRAGTQGYRPPEVLLKVAAQTTAVDTWAAGVVLASALTARYVLASVRHAACGTRAGARAPRAGTQGYRPPEVLLKVAAQTTAVDTWAAGVVLASALTARYVLASVRHAACGTRAGARAPRAGTQGYRPPEVLLKVAAQTTAVDTWAAGVVLASALTARYVLASVRHAACGTRAGARAPRAGTQGYRPPEVLLKVAAQTTAVDTWAAGVVLASALTARYVLASVRHAACGTRAGARAPRAGTQGYRPPEVLLKVAAQTTAVDTWAAGVVLASALTARYVLASVRHAACGTRAGARAPRAGTQGYRPPEVLLKVAAQTTAVDTWAAGVVLASALTARYVLASVRHAACGTRAGARAPRAGTQGYRPPEVLLKVAAQTTAVDTWAAGVVLASALTARYVLASVRHAACGTRAGARAPRAGTQGYRPPEVLLKVAAQTTAVDTWAAGVVLASALTARYVLASVRHAACGTRAGARAPRAGTQGYRPPEVLLKVAAQTTAVDTWAAGVVLASALTARYVLASVRHAACGTRAGARAPRAGTQGYRPPEVLLKVAAQTTAVDTWAAGVVLASALTARYVLASVRHAACGTRAGARAPRAGTQGYRPPEVLLKVAAQTTAVDTWAAGVVLASALTARYVLASVRHAACGTRAGARAPRAGTQGYRPPEVLLKVAAQTTAVDTWAAGVVLASALTARYVLASVRHAACGTRAGARAPRAGTQGYRPPEVLLKVAAQTTAVDTWAAGVVLASALTARYVLASVRHAACGTRAGARAPRAGTQGYRPPEVLLKVAAQTTAVDTWAAGVVLASALTARYVLASVRHAACGTRAGARAPRAGTQGYRPPEVLLKVAAQTTAVDTWAAGVVLASALTARYVLASVRHAACGTRAGARAPRAGTQGYRPPEVLLKVAAQTTAVDTWAAGVVLASALTARYVLASVRHAACGTRAGARAPRAGTQGYRPPEVLLKVAAQTTAVDTWAAGVVLASALTARYVLASVRHAACGTRAGARAPRAGTQGYRPPEVLLKVAAQTTAVDTWAAGVVLASALTARYPFLRAPDDVSALAELGDLLGSAALARAAAALGRRLVSSERRRALCLRRLAARLRGRPAPPRAAPPPPPPAPAACARCRTERADCLCRDESDEEAARFSPTRWVAGFPDSAFSLAVQLLQPDPRRRLSAAAALHHPFLQE